jgi:hypothetical protein
VELNDMNSDPDVSAERLQARIRKWLTEEGKQSTEERIKDLVLITFYPSPTLTVQAMVRRGRITVPAFAPFNETLLLSVEDRDRFLKEIEMEFFHLPCDFQREFDEKTGQLIGLLIFRNIYEESLTKTSFFDTVLLVIYNAWIFGRKQSEIMDNNS